MNRVLFSMAAVLGGLLPLIFDSALKGAALLAVAAFVALALWRASAAARHLVWLVAVVALLVVPVLSLALPQWRVLPSWAVVEQRTKETKGTAPLPEWEPVAEDESFSESESPLPIEPRATAPLAAEPAAAPLPTAHSPLPTPGPTWRDWLPLAWCVGFALLAIRLLAAHLLLRRATRGCAVAADHTIAVAFTQARQQLGIRQRVTLLLDERRTIPVVWGVLRPRLMLPLEAREWSDEQLHSVLLHELAHIKRRDTLVQWLTQLACALHWFNPLVWLAAWRIHTERERACDDLVLASGVRPSAYAEHLLDIATRLSPARWTSASGLAMARKSSLETRLRAVLSEKLNRRGVTSALAAIALILGAGIAIPVAMLRAADDKWNPPSGAHIGGNDFSTFCIHDGKDTSFVIAYHGDFDSTSRSSSNAKARTWNNDVTLIAKKPGIALTFLRTHVAPGKLSITTAPAEGRDLSKPAPAPRDFGQKEYDLAKGRVFLLTDTGLVRQFDLPTPIVTDQPSAKKLAALIAAIPPQVREDIVLQPKHEYARSLFRKWQASARTDGKIPGALIGHVAREVDGFLKQSPDSDESKKLAAVRPRLDASRDWAQAEVVALLDDITAISTAPVSWADIPMEFSSMRTVQGGEGLPIELTSAAWGAPMPNGLRAAWLLEPRGEQYTLGSVLKARVLFHNAGKTPVVFKTETWHQADGHTARDAKGAEIKVGGSWFTGITPVATFRLAPGEYCEVKGHGIAIGAGKYEEEHSTGAVGAIIEAKEGDAVTLSHSVDTSHGGWSRPGDPKDPMELWKATIAERIANEAPMPASAADRAQLIRRVTLDIFGEPPTAEEIAAFTADDAPDALAKLTARLQAKQRVEPFAGKLPTGETKFRVIAADPDAAKAPRIANGPGRYVLGDNVHLLVSQLTEGGKRTNKAVIAFLSPDPKVASPYKPHEIALPDGIGTYGIVWDRGANALWVMQKDLVRKYEFANPAQVQEMRIVPGSIINIPAHMQEPMKKAFNVAGGPVQQQNSQKPKDGAQHSPATKTQIATQFSIYELAVGALEKPTKMKLSDAERLVAGAGKPMIKQHLTTNSGNRAVIEIIGEYRREVKPGVWQTDNIGVEYEIEPEWLTTGIKAHGKMVLAFHEGVYASLADALAQAAAQNGEPQTVKPSGKVRRLTQDYAGEFADDEVMVIPLASQGLFPGTAIVVLTMKKLGPITGAQIQPATEQKLKWGEPANGLRMALAWPPTLGEAGLGDAPEFYLVVQNVSGAAVRFTAGDAAPNPRRLMMRDKGRPLQALSDPTTMPGDWLLQPREVAFFRLYQSNAEWKDGRTISSAIEGDIRSSPQYSMTAEMSIEKAPAGAWTGKLSTGETRGSVDVIPPKDKDAQALFKTWMTAARRDGKIPGGLIGDLGERTKVFIRANTGDASGDPYAKKMAPLVPRFDATRDWDGAEAVALLDDIAAVSGGLLGFTNEELVRNTITTGTPLPPQLADAPWGEAVGLAPTGHAHPNGLRVAYLLEPRVAEHRLNTPLAGRILIHNAGKEPVVFRTRGWHQLGHTARDAKGAEIKVEATNWLTRGQLTPFRLAPGEFVELNTPGIGIGPMKNDDDVWQKTRVGSWLDVKPGDDVTVTTGAVPLSDWNEEGNEPRWWLEHIKTRLARHTPFPADKAARELVLYRVAMELFGNPVNEAVNAAFVADTTPGALDALAERLAKREGVVPFSVNAFVGTLTPAPTKFRVLPADPDAAKRPRTANNPGRYTLSDLVRFVVTRRGVGERIVNEADIVFYPPGKDNVINKVTLPDGYDTWAAAWVKDTTALWVTQKGLLRKMDFTNPAKVEETRYEDDKAADAPIPADIREALRAALDVPDAPKQQYEPLNPAVEAPKTEKPKDGADAGDAKKLPPVDGPPVRPRLADDRYAKSGVPLAEQTWPMPPWGAEKDGLSAGIRIIGEARIGGEVKAELWVRNSSAKDVKFSQCHRADVGLSVVAKDKDGKEHSADITSFRGYPVFSHLLLPAGHIMKVKEFSVKFGANKNDKLEPGWVNLQLTPGDYKLHAKWSDTTSMVAPEGEWTGKLTTGEVDLKIAAANAGADAAKPRIETSKPPEQARLWNNQYSAVAYQTAQDVNFVLIHEGSISTGLSESYSETSGKWSIEGNIHLVNAEKTKAAGSNVDKRKVALKYTSEAPGTLILDGKKYDLSTGGRVFILRDEGEPEQLEKTLPLRDKADLEKLGTHVHWQNSAGERRVVFGAEFAKERIELVQLNAKREAALVRYQPDHRVVKALDEEIAASNSKLTALRIVVGGETAETQQLTRKRGDAVISNLGIQLATLNEEQTRLLTVFQPGHRQVLSVGDEISDLEVLRKGVRKFLDERDGKKAGEADAKSPDATGPANPEPKFQLNPQAMLDASRAVKKKEAPPFVKLLGDGGGQLDFDLRKPFRGRIISSEDLAAINAAKERYSEVVARYNELQPLYAHKLIPRQMFDEAAAALREAQMDYPVIITSRTPTM